MREPVKLFVSYARKERVSRDVTFGNCVLEATFPENELDIRQLERRVNEARNLEYGSTSVISFQKI